MQRLCMIANQLSGCPVTGATTTCPQSGCTGTTKSTCPPIKVTVTGGAGAIGYALVFMIGQGRMFGPTRPVDLTILELPFAEGAMKGVIMELEDCALPLLNSIRGTTNTNEAFKGCEVAVLVGAKPRGPGMERKDLLEQNAKIFMEQGKAINDNADRNCKILVVGNPANTNAMTVSLFAPNIPKKNITALTRLDQNRAVTQIATKVGVPVSAVKNIIIWGNHSSTQYPDPFQGYIINYPAQGIATTIRAAVNDDKWLTTSWIPRVQKRGAEIIAARKLSSAASAANAVCDHINSWINGTKPGEVVSMGVISDGSYGVPKGLNFSFPCISINGDLKIVENFKFDEFAKKMIETTTKELQEERDLVQAFVNSSKK